MGGYGGEIRFSSIFTYLIPIHKAKHYAWLFLWGGEMVKSTLKKHGLGKMSAYGVHCGYLLR